MIPEYTHTTAPSDTGPARPMTHAYQIFQVGIVLLVLATCSSPDPARGTARLSWDASAGTDIAGYKIYLATASGAYGPPVATTSADVTTYTVTDLAPDTTYFFVVTAFNLGDLESAFSNEVSKRIP